MARSIHLDSSHRGGDLLATALGTSVLMWAVAYVGLSPAINAPPLLMAGFVLACVVACGAYIARMSSRGVSGGIKAGLLLGFINFLIVASLHGRDTTADAIQVGAKWIVAFTLIAMVLSATGAWLAARVGRPCNLGIDWTSRLAIVVAVAVFPLLVSGGIVTGKDAGLAVPDWLTTFGYPMMFYPLAAMQEDAKVYAEHFHRLWGLLVGLSTILLAVHLHRVDQRAWLRWLSIVIVLAVALQGAIGGGWVLDTKVRAIAVGHGVFGQIVFAAVVAMAAFTSRTWLSAFGSPLSADSAWPKAADREPRAGSIDLQASITLFVLLIIQLALGATYRHFRREALDAAAGMSALWAHIVLATLLIGAIVFVAGRAWGVHQDKPVLPRLGVSMLYLMILQVLLGVGALMVAMKRGDTLEPFMWEIGITTAHQAVGALMLAVAGLIVVWSWRLLREPAYAKPQAAPTLSHD